MTPRSLLFVPGDRPERVPKGLASGADALILDLEDSVAPGAKQKARVAVAASLAAHAGVVPLYVRINPLGSGHEQADLDALRATPPAALVLPKCEGAAQVEALARLATALGPVPVMPIATETPAALFALGSYAQCRGSLAALTWGVEDLSAAIGAASAREADGSYTPPYELARSLALFAAHAAGVPAIDTVYPDLADEAGLARYAARSRRDGFSGMMALHPRQVPLINAAFTPTPAELEWARRVVDAFAAQPGQGVLAIDGRMVDVPHLKLAKRLLARVDARAKALG